eukprot:TRINITY_DN12787_c0_g1_i1.p1 TRINITY_DN12787_c0_g1~~TRINITY_DN12787_c0_g1_i1.p1  ORF type:complete len:124 (+),score=33.47 TRINITY_DN12787_c0_g1_i1:320-691(+)
MLAGMLMEHKKTNERLDREEVARATEKLRKVDRSERQATLLSQHINTDNPEESREDYDMEVVDGKYVKVFKPYVCDYRGCGARFKDSTSLNSHFAEHRKNERENLRRQAEVRAENLFKSLKNV